MDLREQVRRAAQGGNIAPDMNIANANQAALAAEKFNSGARLAVGAAAAGATADAAEQQRQAEAQARAEAKRQAELAEKNAKGEGWQKVRKEDGGFDFFDAFGKKVNVWTYSQYTGKDPEEVLGDSDYELDIQFLNDYKNTKDAMNAYTKGQPEKYWNNVAAELYDEMGDLPAGLNKKKTEQEVARRQEEAKKKMLELRAKFEGDGNTKAPIQRLRAYYPNVFGAPGEGRVGDRFSR